MDDKTLYACGKNLDVTSKFLKTETKTAINNLKITKW